MLALACWAKGAMLQGCEGKENEVSKWVGTYKVESKLYTGEKFMYDDPKEYVIGDIPNLFLDQSTSSAMVGPVVEIVLKNTNDQISFFRPHVAPLTTSEGTLVSDRFIHLDTTFNVYANPATAEQIQVDYVSSEEAYDLNAKALNPMRWVGPYTKTSSQNHDCRKYESPCKK